MAMRRDEREELPRITTGSPYDGARGREIVGLTVTGEDANRNVYDHPPPGATTASIQGRTLAQVRELYGGDVFTLTSSTTGRQHRVALTPFAALDPHTTYVEIAFHFSPAPFSSKEARLIKARTLREIRQMHEAANDWHTGAVARREAEAGVPPEERVRHETDVTMTAYAQQRADAYLDLAIRTGILRHGESAAIHNEYAAQYPDVFSAWGLS